LISSFSTSEVFSLYKQKIWGKEIEQPHGWRRSIFSLAMSLLSSRTSLLTSIVSHLELPETSKTPSRVILWTENPITALVTTKPRSAKYETVVFRTELFFPFDLLRAKLQKRSAILGNTLSALLTAMSTRSGLCTMMKLWSLLVVGMMLFPCVKDSVCNLSFCFLKLLKIGMAIPTDPILSTFPVLLGLEFRVLLHWSDLIWRRETKTDRGSGCRRFHVPSPHWWPVTRPSFYYTCNMLLKFRPLKLLLITWVFPLYILV